MSTRLTKGVLCISITRGNAPVASADEFRLEQTFDRLLGQCDRLALAATWAIEIPGNSRLVERLGASRIEHETALAADATWVRAAQGRVGFGRDLASRMLRAQASGLRVSTMLLQGTRLDDHFDLAIKHGISVLSQDVQSPKGRLLPQSLRFGLWSFPVAASLPGASRWLPGGGGAWNARTWIDRAIASQGLVQLSIDAARLGAKSAAERGITRVLEYAARQQHAGALEVLTLQAAVERLTEGNQATPSRSILRPAAA